MLVSIFKDGSKCYGVDYSKNDSCKEVVEISDTDFAKIQAGTHTLDLETKELVEVPVVEEEVIEEIIEEDLIS